MSTDTRIQLICNAHLDPVWKWDWEEGLTEALSTFETAADLLDENADWIFNHNESVLYEWVLDYRPDLFARIQKHVASGRWHIAGGWYLQPDCNLPDGESFIRQISIGRKFFRRHFGVEPELAYNFDAFGHHGNLPQILRKTGYRAYVHFRPSPENLKLPADLYWWEGIDGSRVLGYRPPFAWYGTDDHEDLRGRIEDSLANKKGPVGIFWGMGDHGGGATRDDLRMIAQVQKKYDSVVHGSARTFLAELEKAQDGAPLWQGDLQRVFTGCYSSVSATKQSNRRSESLVQQAERYATLAWWFLKKPFPAAKLEAIWKDVLFNQFHDILPGSSTRKAMGGTYEIAGRAMKEAREVILHSQLALMARKTRRKPLTVVVFNPHPYPCRLPVDLEYMVGHRPIFTRFVQSRIVSSRGKNVPCQDEMSGAVTTKYDWRKRVVFEADLPAAGYAEFAIHLDTRTPPERPKSGTGLTKEWRWQNAFFTFVLDSKTGLVRTLTAGRDGKTILRQPGGRLGVFADDGDSWGTDIWRYGREAGHFRLATREEAAELTGQAGEAALDPVRLIEDGPVRSVVECLFVYERSTAAIRYFLHRERAEIEVEVRVIWNQPGKQIKWIWPTRFAGGAYRAEIPYGDISRRQGEGEHTHSRWLAVEDENTPDAFGITGIGPSGHEVSEGEIRITLLRSVIYAHSTMHSLRREIFHDFMDLGETRFRFALLPATDKTVRERLLRVTERLTLPATALVHYPLAPVRDAGVPSAKSLIAVEGDGIETGAIKPSDDGRALILRLVERNGHASKARLKIAGCGQWTLAFSPYEIKTLRVDRRGNLAECDLLEKRLPARAQPRLKKKPTL